MKRAAFHHRKVKRLGRALNLEPWGARGILESLWFVTAQQKPRGDIGSMSNQDIADEIGWDADADALVDALVKSGWLDESKPHRLLVHDWAEHCDNGVKQSKVVKDDGFASDDDMPPTESTPSQTNPNAEPTPSIPTGNAGPMPDKKGSGSGLGSGWESAERGAVVLAIDAIEEWAAFERQPPPASSALASHEETDLTRRLSAMDDALPWIPQAVRDCRKKGVAFKSVAYVMTPILNRVDELRREKPGAPPPPAITPESVYQRCRSHVTFDGERCAKGGLGHNGAGLMRGGKLWVPTDRLGEVKVDG